MKGMESVDGQHDQTMLWGNLATAIAYFVITSQLLLFVLNPKVVKIFYAADDAKDSKKRQIFRLLLATAVLFASFISLCGAGHLMNVLVVLNPNIDAVKRGQGVVMWLTAIVSFCTALAGFPLFPTIANAIKGLQLNSDGKLQLAESYLIEVVDLIKESILVLSDDLVVLKCNDVTKLLFCGDVVGTNIREYIHPVDLPLFNDAIAQAAESYTFGSTTVEVRIEYDSSTTSPKFNPQKHLKRSASKFHKTGKSYRVYTTEEPALKTDREGDIELGESTPLNAEREAEIAQQNYIWIEVTVCKGKQVMVNGSLIHDMKLVCRNIDDRKKRQAFQALVESTEERGRINESKLRYVSCIAHDLKTPLQSFSFSLDLLSNTDLHPEQRELMEHASVAIDLMKLTISQTMDISKALTGAKLMPRRATVFLSSVLNRVKIIINGYGKQVPVSFEVAPDVCDEIITDEEWLWQMLLNLLTNACKYTDRGSIIVRLSVTTLTSVSTEERMSSFALVRGQSIPMLSIPQEAPFMLLCEVLDTGIGISPEKIGHIFDAFAQVQEGQVTGTGLGLFGVRTRAEGLLGTCGARHNTESSTGTGTVLWFALPYVPNFSSSYSVSDSPKHNHLANDAFRALQMDCAPPTPSLAPASAPTRAPVVAKESEKTGRLAYEPSAIVSPNERHKSVELSVHTNSLAVHSMDKTRFPLRASGGASNQTSTEVLIRALRLTAMVVEDTPTVRKLMQKLLLSMGFESVVCYENGSKGLEAMMAAPVDIVFSDVQMPIMTGPEMTRRFRMWETSIATENQAADSPTRSTAGNASLNNSFLSDSDLHETRNALHSSPPPPSEFRKRQLIVAVTANSAECEKGNDSGFDEVCPKPLTRADIYKVITRHFQYE